MRFALILKCRMPRHRPRFIHRPPVLRAEDYTSSMAAPRPTTPRRPGTSHPPTEPSPLSWPPAPERLPGDVPDCLSTQRRVGCASFSRQLSRERRAAAMDGEGPVDALYWETTDRAVDTRRTCARPPPRVRNVVVARPPSTIAVQARDSRCALPATEPKAVSEEAPDEAAGDANAKSATLAAASGAAGGLPLPPPLPKHPNAREPEPPLTRRMPCFVRMALSSGRDARILGHAAAATNADVNGAAGDARRAEKLQETMLAAGTSAAAARVAAARLQHGEPFQWLDTYQYRPDPLARPRSATLGVRQSAGDRWRSQRMLAAREARQREAEAVAAERKERNAADPSHVARCGVERTVVGAAARIRAMRSVPAGRWGAADDSTKERAGRGTLDMRYQQSRASWVGADKRASDLSSFGGAGVAADALEHALSGTTAHTPPKNIDIGRGSPRPPPFAVSASRGLPLFPHYTLVDRRAPSPRFAAPGETPTTLRVGSPNSRPSSAGARPTSRPTSATFRAGDAVPRPPTTDVATASELHPERADGLIYRRCVRSIIIGPPPKRKAHDADETDEPDPRAEV